MDGVRQGDQGLMSWLITPPESFKQYLLKGKIPFCSTEMALLETSDWSMRVGRFHGIDTLYMLESGQKT